MTWRPAHEATTGDVEAMFDAGYEVVASPTLRRRVVRHHLAEPS